MNSSIYTNQAYLKFVLVFIFLLVTVVVIVSTALPFAFLIRIRKNISFRIIAYSHIRSAYECAVLVRAGEYLSAFDGAVVGTRGLVELQSNL